MGVRQNRFTYSVEKVFFHMHTRFKKGGDQNKRIKIIMSLDWYGISLDVVSMQECLRI